MGVSSAGGAKLTVTDDDIIEKSNLSRQFLFRNHNVGQSKSLSGVNAATVMNPALKAVALQDRVSPDTENVFNTPSGSRSMLSSMHSTMSRRGSTSIQSASSTTSRSLSRAPSAQSATRRWSSHTSPRITARRATRREEAPQCAVHNFPHNIDQCLVLAQSEFVGNFDTAPKELSEFLAKGAKWVEGLVAAQESTTSILDKLRGDQRVTCGMAGGCRDLLIAERATTWAACVGWARRKYESYFVSRVTQLLHNFPPDSENECGPCLLVAAEAHPQAAPLRPERPDAHAVCHRRRQPPCIHVWPPAARRQPRPGRDRADPRDRARVPVVTTFVPFTDSSIETETQGGR